MGEGLILEDLVIFAGTRRVIGVDDRVAPGEVLTLMGPSGIGKSTVLAAITGTLPPGFAHSGRVHLDREDITDRPTNRRRIGILFQDDLLFPHLSVGQNLAFGLAPGGSRRERRRTVAAALAEIGLDGFAERDPATLSGGQKARVSLMRMLLSRPRALLLDEAFAGLDPERRARTRSMVFGIARDRRLPVLMVTHDAGDATAAGGRVIELGGN